MVINQLNWNGIFIADTHGDIMPLFSEKYFSWREPKEFLMELDRDARSQLPWRFLWGVAVLNVMILAGVSALAATHSGKGQITLVQAFIMTLLGIEYVVLIHPMLVAKMPSIVEFKGDYVVRARGGITFLALKQVRSFSWHERPNYRLLVLREQDGADLKFGIPGEVQKDQLSTFLRSRSIYEESNGDQ
ncbi:MAG: hypothetical protein JWO94_267 [Verrucomicrobiaceae bacterium]|nr:hypothetical protein [Verrucomicrobiaceae bacterium]